MGGAEILPAQRHPHIEGMWPGVIREGQGAHRNLEPPLTRSHPHENEHRAYCTPSHSKKSVKKKQKHTHTQPLTIHLVQTRKQCYPGLDPSPTMISAAPPDPKKIKMGSASDKGSLLQLLLLYL